MDCPKCHGELHEMRLEGVDFDICSQCKGLWFDKDELAVYAELHMDTPDIEETIKSAKETDLDCPRCEDVTLEELKFIKSSDLLIDRCSQCHGIFLDKGELAKVEDLSVGLMDHKSRMMMVGKQLKEKGYQVLGVRFQ